MAEQDRASFGVFPQLRRNRTRQDPEAAKNVPVAALRGFVSGVAGAPGDLESIAYMPYDYFRSPTTSELVTGEKKTKTFFPTSEEIEKKIPFRGTSPVEQAFTGAGQLAGGFYYGRGSPLRVLAESPQILKKAGMDFARSIAPVNVVKPTGKGNWTAGTGSLDEAINKGNLKADPSAGSEIPYHQIELDELMAKDAETPGRYTRTIQRVQQNLKDLQRENALNNWVEGNLKNYMQKQMGTPNDPIRALAEKGIAHHDFPAGRHPAGNITKRRRKEAGFPEEGVAQSELAKRWEHLADATINPVKAGEIRSRIAAQDVNSSKYQTILDENPWLSKLPDDEVVNMTNRYNFRELGFDHMIDVLRADVAAGRIRPEQLNRVSVEDAVKRVHAYDQEAAKKAAVEEMESMKANLSQTPYKEYGTGYKWVELPDPAASPENQKLIQNVGCQGGWCTMDEPNVYRYGEHEKGNRLYALLDQEGRPHTQIHVQQKPLPVSGEAFAMLPSAKKAEYGQMVREWRRRNPDIEELTDAHTTQALIEGGVTPEKVITQIKPFSNRWDSEKVQEFTKRNPKYRQEIEPYLQDFVRSGNWSKVDDLENTGLIPADVIRKAGWDMSGNNQKYFTKQEYDDLLLNELNRVEGNGMKRGGPVHLSKGTKAAEIVEATAEGIANLFAKYSGKAPKEAKEAMPLVLPRAAPKTSQEINDMAERVARQMIGEHVTPQGKTVNLAGRSKKEAERVKQLQFELTPTGTVAQAKVNNPQIGDVNVAFPGDQTISDTILDTLKGETINSLQQGGAKYGLGQLHLIDPEFWKSNIGPAQGIQGRIDDLYAKYMPERMVGEHLAMGPMSNNFAMHFADANLKALDWSKLKPKNVDIFDSHITDGYVIKKKNKKTGEVTEKVIKFPDWPGLASPDLAFDAMQKNPELRKWFNNRMKVPDLTQPLGLPNGRDIEYAISEPAIRNLEINMTGLNTGILKPNAPVEPLGNIHNTYTHRILGEAIGPREVLSPFTMSYPDATAHVMRTQSPSDFTGTIQKVFPHQVVDQQYLDEMGKYQDKVKQITGYQKGGEVELPDLDFDDKESANLYKYAMKTLGMQGEQSGAGGGANIPLGDGNLNLGVNFNKSSMMPNQMGKSLDASYGTNINGIGVNANVSKPLDVDGVYQGMLDGSIPVGLGRLMLGLQAQKTPYGSGVTGYTAGYQGKVGDGMLSATINQPKNRAASRSAQVQYQMPFAKGGAVEYNPAEIDTIASSLYEELYG